MKKKYIPKESKVLAQFDALNKKWAFIQTKDKRYVFLVFSKYEFPDYIYEWIPSVGFRQEI